MKHLGTQGTNEDVAKQEDISIKSNASGEPSGSDVILNVVSLTQSEYDAGTPVSTTLYIING